jgi:hypothetical protein
MSSVINYIHNSISQLNNSKYFAGIIMLIINVGAKYATFSLSKTQEEYIKNSIAREMLIFSFVWMGTHDIYISIITTAAFIILADFLFNEKSSCCIMPEKYKKYETIMDLNKDGIVSDDEIKKAEEVLAKAKKQKKQYNQLDMMSYLKNNI